MSAKGSNILLSVMLVASIVAGCAGASPKEEPTPTPIVQASVTSKPTYLVETGTIVDEVKFSGRIAPVLEETLFFRTDGRLSRLPVQVGGKVKKGDILAELDVTDLLNQQAQAEITLQTAQLKLKSAEQNVTEQHSQGESALRVARLRLAQAQIKDPAPNITIAAGNRDKALAALAQAQSSYDAKKSRPDIAALSESLNLQKATIDYEIVKAQYDLAVQAQKSWEYDVQLLQESVSVAEANLQKVAASIDPALAQDVSKSQLVVDRLKTQVANSRVVATMDGDVTAVTATAGRTVQAYSPVVTIAAPSELEVSADLLSTMVQSLSVGQTCLIEMSNYPSRVFHGTIRRIPSVAIGTASLDQDRSSRVKLTDADVTLEIGALVRVTVILQQKDNVLWIPLPALRSFQGKDFVLVLEGEVQRRVPVTVGVRTAEKVEIVSGLTAGQVVVGP